VGDAGRAGRRCARRSRWGLALAGGVGGAGLARAASGDCVTTGTQVTCTYTDTGGAQQFTVPAGVGAVTVEAIGGDGSSGYSGGAGGAGDVVTATLTGLGSVPTLYVYVGGNTFDGTGGFNGGGAGFAPDLSGGGGGGASDVRTASGDLHTRLVVAGGGGGGGGGGGAAPTSGGAGGTAGGAGGTGSNGGGAGGAIGVGGGGGGAYGGGGGGAGGAGGGGGSDLTATTVGGVTSAPLGSPARDTAGTPKVVITYTVGSTPCVSNCNANATPELGSGELLATGLLPLGAVLLYRRRRARRRGPM